MNAVKPPCSSVEEEILPTTRRPPATGWRVICSFVGLVIWLLACGPTSDQSTEPGRSDWPSSTQVSERSQPANILLVLSDTHRWDHALADESGAVETPHLDRLAQQGVRFASATTPIPISAPAYASLMTGQPPLAHGLLNNAQNLDPSLPVLAEILRRRGYTTGAVIGNPFCSSSHGFGRGFDHLWDDVATHGKEGNRLTDAALSWLDGRSQEPDAEPFFLFVAYMDAHTPYVTPDSPPTLSLAVDGTSRGAMVAEDAHRLHHFDLAVPPGVQRLDFRFLKTDGNPAQPPQDLSPLYLSELTLDDPQLSWNAEGLFPVPGREAYRQMAQRVDVEVHNPTAALIHSRLSFRVHRKYEAEETPALYAAGVRHVDRQLGRLMESLEHRGLSQETFVVFVSDHGEMLGEHGAWGHVDHLWQETLRVPLILKGPGLPSGVEYSGAFDLMDLHHLLRLLSGEDTESLGLSGSEPFPFVRQVSEANLVASETVAATYPPEAAALQVALTRDERKLVLTTDVAPQLFDLQRDVAEQADLWDTSKVDAELRQMLRDAQAHLAEALRGESLDTTTLSPETRRQLEALGYLD